MLATSAMKGIGSTTVASVAKSPACPLFILRNWTVRHARCHTTQAHGVRPCGKNLTVSFFSGLPPQGFSPGLCHLVGGGLCAQGTMALR
jgi:hypothetical protein